MQKKDLVYANFKNKFCYENKGNIQMKFYFQNRNPKIWLFKYQKFNKKYKDQVEKLNFRIVNNILSSQSQLSQQTKYKKIITKYPKYKIIGGGSGQSKQIQPMGSSKNKQDQSHFMKKYNDFINKKSIVKSIEQGKQGNMQMQIIECFKENIQHLIQFQNELMKLIDVYFVYFLTGSLQKDLPKQNEIKSIESLLKFLKNYFYLESQNKSEINQICNPKFFFIYFDILYRLNTKRKGMDEKNKSQIDQVMQFITMIEKFGLGKIKGGEDFMKVFRKCLQSAKFLLKQNKQSKYNQLSFYLMDIQVKKTETFEDRIYKLTLLEELSFYMTLFNKLCRKKDYDTDLILLTLIKIYYYFSLAFEDQNKIITLSQELSLNFELINVFIPIIIQNNEILSFSDEMKSFLKFTIQNHEYQFLTISILLKFYQIIKIQDYKKQIIEYLCYKYLCENDKQAILFEKSKEFMEQFYFQMKKEKFLKKIIQLSNDRRKVLQIPDLEKYEKKIENLDELKVMTNNKIEKSSQILKIYDRNAQLDSMQNEKNELYIKQQITFLKGVEFNKLKQNSTQNNEQKELCQNKNALEDILDFFLNYKTLQESKNENNQEQNKCKILGILAEGGTGKSMLMKQLKSELIKKTNPGLKNEQYLPFLIQCNSLNPQKPSIENQLQEQGMSQSRIKEIKKSDLNKVILLDGYDEFTGEQFRVYKKLNLNEWNNTKFIVTSRIEKLELSQACVKFSLDNDKGVIDEASFSIVKLEKFTKEDILKYYDLYFKQYSNTIKEKAEEINQQQIGDCIKNPILQNLLKLPINLCLFTKIVIDLKIKTEIEQIQNISDSIDIYEFFFNELFKSEAKEFTKTSTQMKETDENNNDLNQQIVDSLFEYFQSISMMMFLNKGRLGITNFLQIRKEKIQVKLSKQIIENKQLLQEQKSQIFEKFKLYANSNNITNLQEEIQINKLNFEEDKSYVIEFKHKSFFEYFVARAMKYDFYIFRYYDLAFCNLEYLKEFNINKKCIMNAGQNQSEQKILINLYNMIKNEIESKQFYEQYQSRYIQNNDTYIQYIKRSKIEKNTQISLIDIGASNLLSALFVSKFAYPKLKFEKCSFSKLYVSRQKSDLIKFDFCNLQNAYLKNLQINYDTCNTQFANFDTTQKVFDTYDFFSYNKIIWDRSKIQTLHSITKSGFINSFKIEEKNIILQKSIQLSFTSLSQILIFQNCLLISTKNSLLLIDSNSFKILKYHKFKNKNISNITIIKKKILVTIQNKTTFYGSFEYGFEEIDHIICSGCVYHESKEILLGYQKGGEISQITIERQFSPIQKPIQGHSSDICSIVFSSNGKFLATSYEDATCKIWNAEENFQFLQEIESNKKIISSIVFSEDGKYLVTSGDRTCKIWNAEQSFNLIKTIEDHTSAISCIAFSADMKYLATGYEDKNCKIWEVEENKFTLFNITQGHSGNVKSVAFSADGKYLATSSEDKTCKIWKILNIEKDFELYMTIEKHTSDISSITFSPDGKYLATGSYDQTFKIWNVENKFELFHSSEDKQNRISSIAFSADGMYLATGSEDSTCKIWNVEKEFILINTIQGHYHPVKSVAFSADGKYLATGSQDSSCKIWNAEKDFELIKVLSSHYYGVYSVAFSANGKYIATGSGDDTCSIFDVEKGFEFIKTIKGHQNTIYSVAFSADGKYFATGSEDQTCKIWNVVNGFELIYTIENIKSKVNSVAFYEIGDYLAIGSNMSCRIQNVKIIFEKINTIQGHIDPIFFVTFSADGKYLATSSSDKTCKIWNAKKNFELINIIKGHTSSIYSVAFSGKGKYLATGSEDKTCKIWDIEKGFEFFKTIEQHTDLVYTVTFSVDEKFLVTGSGSRDRTCKIWNVQNNFELIKTIQGFRDLICCVTFSVDGKYLAASSQDKTCQIWKVENIESVENVEKVENVENVENVKNVENVESVENVKNEKNVNNVKNVKNIENSFELIHKIQEHTNEISSVAFSSDGKYLSTSSWDQSCKIWNVEKGFELINTLQKDSGFWISTFSTDGKYLATVNNKNTCQIWNKEDLIKTDQMKFEPINTIEGTNYCAAFSEDSKYLATISDKTCKIWDVENDFKHLFSI